MTVPAGFAAESKVDYFLAGWEILGQARSADSAKDQMSLGEGAIYGGPPPTFVPELHDGAVGGIELVNEALQPRGGVLVAGWKLEEKASHLLAEDGGDFIE